MNPVIWPGKLTYTTPCNFQSSEKATNYDLTTNHDLLRPLLASEQLNMFDLNQLASSSKQTLASLDKIRSSHLAALTKAWQQGFTQLATSSFSTILSHYAKQLLSSTELYKLNQIGCQIFNLLRSRQPPLSNQQLQCRCNKLFSQLGQLIAKSQMLKDRITLFIDFRLNPNNLKSASQTIRGDKELILYLVKNCQGVPLEYALPSLQQDYEVVLAAVNANGYVLRHASANLRANYSIALAAVSRSGLALEFVDTSLQTNHEIVLAAVKSNGMALRTITDQEYKHKIRLVLNILDNHPALLRFLVNSLNDDYELAMEVVQGHNVNLDFLAGKLQETVKIACAILNYRNSMAHYFYNNLAFTS